MSLKLISATPSPYARKVRIALAEKGIPFELQTEIPWNSTTRTKDFNPLEKLPVLLIPGADGETIEKAVYESHHILEYLELKYGSPRLSLLPEDIDERLAAKEVEVVCDGVCDATVLRLWELKREEGKLSPEWVSRQVRKIEGGTKYLASKIQSGQKFMVGDRFSIADIAAGSALGYLDLRFEDYKWRTAYPLLADYADSLNQRESFAATVPTVQVVSDKVV